MDLSIFFAGTAGSVPSARRGLPALLVRRGGDRILIDCGEGTQRQLLRSVGLTDLTDVFLTHLHTDHWLGLPGMLKSFDLRDREKPLTVHGPQGTKRLLEALRGLWNTGSYEVTIEELEPMQSVRRDDLTITAIGVQHRGAALGYAFVEDERPGRFDADLAQELGVPFGPDFGRLQRGETVNGVTPEQVIGPVRPARKLVFSGDTRPCESIAIAAHRADVLVHEATFLSEDGDRARQTGHSTAGEAATLARDAEVKLLALTHVSTRYAGKELREEARAIHPATEVPRDFDAIDVPLPEKGEPELHHWQSGRPPTPAEATP